jgi:hypothetical protein
MYYGDILFMAILHLELSWQYLWFNSWARICGTIVILFHAVEIVKTEFIFNYVLHAVIAPFGFPLVNWNIVSSKETKLRPI